MKLAVFYFTQSGQAFLAAKSICSSVEKSSSVIYKRIVPQHAYPFPWTKREFFDMFPESRLGLPPSGIQPMDIADVTDADLVMIVGQSWFLSLSLPLQSFLADEQVRAYLKGRDVVFVNVCRNMWVTTLRSMAETLKNIGARLVGHVVLQDRHPNLVSALTIVRWLLHGKKQATCCMPVAGVSDKDITEAQRFGEVMEHTMNERQTDQLQDRLTAVGAVEYKPSIAFIEKTGYRLFGPWARFIRRRGEMGTPARRFRRSLFYVYLVVALFCISPFAQLFYWLTRPLRSVHRTRENDCSLT